MDGSSPLPPIAKRLQDKVAIITGGASGIGATTARLFAKHGAKVIIADIQDDLGHSLVNQIIISTSNSCVSYIHCDVSNESDVKNTVNTAISMHGKLDILYGNAGIGGSSNPSITSISYDEFKKVMDINLYGALLFAKHASRVMIPEKKGSILFTSSVGTESSGVAPYVYAASKSGINNLTKNLCVELGQHGIRVNCISPGLVHTPLASKTLGLDRMEEIRAAFRNLNGVVLEADDIAEAALFLASDESRCVSGINLLIDGGSHLKIKS